MADVSLGDFAVQTFRSTGDDRGYPGSGYLIGPGLILTALHCVVDTKAKGRLPAGPECRVRVIGDFKEANPKLRSWNPDWSYAELQKATGTTWRKARLVWPRGDIALSAVPDVAVLSVDEADRTPLMSKARRPPTFTPIRTFYCFGLGFPAFAARRSEDGKLLLVEIEGVDGDLSAVRKLSDSMRIFTVKSRTPENYEGWKGLSGGALLHEDSGALLGVFGRFEESANHTALGVTPFDEIRDDTFWDLSRLPRPIVGNAPPWRRSTAGVHPADFLHYFDRGPQITAFGKKIDNLPDRPQFPPLVTTVTGRTDDIPDELLRRFEEDVLAGLFRGEQGYLKIPPVDWTKYVGDPEDAALAFLQDIANKVGIRIADCGEDEVKRLRQRFAGVTEVRAFRTCLRASTFDELDESILTRIFKSWKDLGSSPLPPVLFIIIRAASDVKEPNRDKDLLRIKEAIASSAAEAGLATATVVLPALTDCLDEHFNQWEDILAQKGCENPKDYVRRLRVELKSDAFPLLRLQEAIMKV
jgi:Trypsin-like peptidase domain